MSDASKFAVPRVIIADDAPEIRMVLKRTLEICDCDVVASAENGAQAIEFLDYYKPDIIFLDIEMPDKNGFEVLDEIKERQIPVYPIMVSGHSSKHNFTSAIKRGAKGFIVKPHSQKKIEDVIAAYMASNIK